MMQAELKSLQKWQRFFLLTHPYTTDIALAFMMLLLVLTALPTVPEREAGFRNLDVLGYLLMLLQLLALLFLRRWPLMAYAVFQIGFQGYNTLNYGPIQALFLASLIGTYIVAVQTKRWHSLLALLMTLASVTFFFSTTSQTFFWGNILNVYVQWVGAWFLGRLHRLYRERMQAEAEVAQRAAAEAIVEERNRLARELHDSVTQSLHGSTLIAEAAQRIAATGDLERTIGYLVRLGEISQQALKEMRLLVYELRPFALREVGLVRALQQRLNTVERRAGIDPRLAVERDVEGSVELPENVEVALFRIAQEALNNALKHAKATSVEVTIQVTAAPPQQQVVLEVVDDGLGFEIDEVRETGGIGLDSMRERAEKLGGQLVIQSAAGQGTRVKAIVRNPSV